MAGSLEASGWGGAAGWAAPPTPCSLLLVLLLAGGGLGFAAAGAVVLLAAVGSLLERVDGRLGRLLDRVGGLLRRRLDGVHGLVHGLAGVVDAAAGGGIHGRPGRRRWPVTLGHLDVADGHRVLHLPTSTGDDRRRLLDLLVEGEVGAQRDALLDRLHGHRRGLAREDLPVVHRRHDVVGAETLVLGHLGELHRRGDAHLVGDRLGAHVEGAAEDAREADRVVDLVGEVAAAGGYHGGAGLLGVPRPHLGHGVGADEDDRVGRHRLDPVLLDRVRPLLAERDADVGVFERVGDAALTLLFVGDLAVLPLVDPLGPDGLDVAAALVQDALAVDHPAEGRGGSVREDEPADGHVGGARADEGDLHLVDLLAHDLESVDQACQRDASGALLVVVPDGDLALLAQCVEDTEALGLRDVFEVHATQARLHELDELDELVGVLGVDHERKTVDAAEVLVEQRLALHDRQAGLGTDVAHAQHAGAVADHGHRVALVGVLVDLLGVVLDVETGLADARRVPDAEVLKVAHAALERGLDLALVERMELHGVIHGLVPLRLELLDGRLVSLFRHVALLVLRRGRPAGSRRRYRHSPVEPATGATSGT